MRPPMETSGGITLPSSRPVLQISSTSPATAGLLGEESSELLACKLFRKLHNQDFPPNYICPSKGEYFTSDRRVEAPPLLTGMPSKARS